MAQSKHVYTAYLIGDPEVELPIKGGRITLDAGRAPHVTAEIDITPAADLDMDRDLFDLDPRNGGRIRIEASTVAPSTPQTRTFNLGIRERSISQEDGAPVSLSLASDEALLSDWAPMEDDTTPFDLAASTRAVVDYVLDKVIPGAALEATPAHDPDITPYWPVTNLHTNPEVVNPYGYQAGTGASNVVRVAFMGGTAQWDAAAGVSNLVFTPNFNTFRVSAGKWYVASANVISQIPTDAMCAIQWWAADNSSPMQTVEGEIITTSDTELTTLHVVARAPVGAQYMVPFISTLFNPGGSQHFIRRPMVYEGHRVVQDFTGSSVDNANYTYDWAESTHGSPSVRTPVNDTADPDAFTWRAGQSAMEFIAPLLQAKGLRLVCNEAREWTLRDEDYAAPDGISILYATNMINGTKRTSRDTERWMDARVLRYKWRDLDGIEQERIDAYAATIPHTKATLLELDTPYPGPGRAQYAVERAIARGQHEVSATSVADWDAHAEQSTTIKDNFTQNLIGRSSRVTFNLDNDEMTVDMHAKDGP